MTVDTSKILYYTQYNSYKNLQVHSGTIEVDSTSIANGATHNWDTTISVSSDSKFATCLIQNNRDNNPTVTALKWASFPSANVVWQTLAVDPDGFNTIDIGVSLIINNDQVTFRATVFNGETGAIELDPISIGFVYAVHTLAI